MSFNKEYLSAIAVLVVAILQVFKINVAPEAVLSIVTGILALYLAFKQHQQGNTSVFGVRK
jgi:hypothetical protein